MINIKLVLEKPSLEVIAAFDRWIYLNGQMFPFISGEVISKSSLPKGFWRYENITNFSSLE